MRLLTVALVALLCTGCFSIYDIQPNAINQYIYDGVPVELDPETGEMMLAATEGAEGDNRTTQEGSGNQATINIGGKNTAETDMAASLEATLRDLITGNPVN